jgi:hypothetical protein
MQRTVGMLVNFLPSHATKSYLRYKLSNPALLLAGMALISALIYWFAIVEPTNLLDLYQQARLDGSTPYWRDPQYRQHYVLAFAALGAFYWMSWRLALRTRGQLAWAIVAGGCLVFVVALLFFHPIDAADIFDNIMHGRMTWLYGANPFLQTASRYAQDPFYRYMAWKYAPSAYGPLWEMMASVASAIAGEDVIANVLAFKLLPGAFLGGSLVWIAIILRRMAPQRALAGVLLLGWNPIVLYETSGNGHNDMVMVFWILAAACALVYERYTLAILALVVGALVKFIPILFIPLVLWLALRDLPDRRARLRFLILSAAAGMTLVVLAYAPFWHGLATLSVSRRLRLFSGSLPAFLYQALREHIEKKQAASLVGASAGFLAVIFTLWQSWRASRDRSWLSFSRAAFNIMMFYLLVTCLWFQQWYTLWPLAIAALLPPGHFSTLAILFTYTAVNKQFIVGPVLFAKRPFLPQPWLELRFAVGMLAIPWVYTLFTIWRNSYGPPARESILSRPPERAEPIHDLKCGD